MQSSRFKLNDKKENPIAKQYFLTKQKIGDLENVLESNKRIREELDEKVRMLEQKFKMHMHTASVKDITQEEINQCLSISIS